MSQESFSNRSGYSGGPKEITIREGVTDYVRRYAIRDAIGKGVSASDVREIVCRIIHAVPDLNNWSNGPILGEVDDLVSGCKWWHIYDIIEAIFAQQRHYEETSEYFEYSPGMGYFSQKYADGINKLFVEEGIGWKLENGSIVARGSDAFEISEKAAIDELRAAGRVTAGDRLREAFADLSRRPKPDLAGAIFHAMGALECVARDVTGDEKATLGEIIKKYPGVIPRPLDEAVSKARGFASNEARHVVEGGNLTQEDVELIIGLSATVVTYLSKKVPRNRT